MGIGVPWRSSIGVANFIGDSAKAGTASIVAATSAILSVAFMEGLLTGWARHGPGHLSETEAGITARDREIRKRQAAEYRPSRL